MKSTTKTCLRLKRDLVIPAGTLFGRAPERIDMDDSQFVEATIGLSKNTYGTLLYCAGEPGSDDRKELRRWFEEVAVATNKRKRKRHD